MTRRGTPFAPGSIRNLEADFRNHVDPYFGAARLDEIDRGDLQRWIRGLTSGELSHLKRPLSPSAIANCLKPVRLVFRVEAENDATFPADPFTGLRLPTALAAKERAIALVELAQQIAALPDTEMRMIYGLAG